MAIFEVKVPQLSESVAEATLLQWKKKVGDAVGQDEILIEIETDKVVLEVPAPSAGVLTEIVVADGGTVVAEQLIAKIDSTAVAAAAPAAAAPAPVAAPAAAPAKAAAPAAKSSGAAAAPSAAKILAEKNIDAGQVAGSGRDGRITKGDVINTLSKPAATPAATALPQTQEQLKTMLTTLVAHAIAKTREASSLRTQLEAVQAQLVVIPVVQVGGAVCRLLPQRVAIGKPVGARISTTRSAATSEWSRSAFSYGLNAAMSWR